MESCVMMGQGSHTLSSGKYFLSQSMLKGILDCTVSKLNSSRYQLDVPVHFFVLTLILNLGASVKKMKVRTSK